MKARRTRERPTLDLLEESVHLLRTCPAHLFAWYLAGVLPFLLALLYFWMDMSWSAVAFQHRTEASLGVAIAFIWMKSAQSVFAEKLRAQLARRAEEQLTPRRLLRIAAFQATIQPSKLFLVPLAALATIPYGWLGAFYENATVLGAGDGLRDFMARCSRQASFWPRQNHFAKAIYLLLVSVVFLNVAILILLLPELLKIFTGVETIFTRSRASIFNTTFFAIIGALTYLVCDPLLKAIYTVRCFYGESVRSGADLAAEIRALPRVAPAVAAVIATALVILSPMPAAQASDARATQPLSAPELDRAITETLQRPEFTWKLPRQVDSSAPQQKSRFVNAVERLFKATGRVIKRTLEAIGRWFEKLFQRRDGQRQDQSAGAWQGISRFWLTALLVLLVAAVGVLARLMWKMRARRKAAPRRAATAKAVNIEDENLTADLLPEDEWLALARAHLARGELRLALRAFFLAGLAHLAAREVLLLARHKSNRDYHAELQRKARDRAQVVEAFRENVSAVERVWYGRHEIREEELRRFEANLDLIRAC